MQPVKSIRLTPKKNPVFVEVTPPKLCNTFQEANRYIRDLQMLTFKGQETDVSFRLEWVVQGVTFAVEGSFKIEFKTVHCELNLVELVMRKLVTQIEQRTNIDAGIILRTCFIGDQPCVSKA